jgi:hypothetical protein
MYAASNGNRAGYEADSISQTFADSAIPRVSQRFVRCKHLCEAALKDG